MKDIHSCNLERNFQVNIQSLTIIVNLSPITMNVVQGLRKVGVTSLELLGVQVCLHSWFEITIFSPSSRGGPTYNQWLFNCFQKLLTACGFSAMNLSLAMYKIVQKQQQPNLPIYRFLTS